MSVKNITLNNETWFKIEHTDSLRPFFMSMVSDSNHWMFISSNGGLTAGRKNAEYALFPYYTDDKLTELADITGSKTIVQIKGKDSIHLWEPFSDRFNELFTIERNVYKSIYGNKIMFEEIVTDFGLAFRYEWSTSNLFGFVKKSELINHSDSKLDVTILDGLQNIMPYGVSPDLQTSTSNLVDAYKRSELVKETGLGVYALSAIIVDKAEPSEALKANVVWSFGQKNPTYLMSSLQLNKFRKKQVVTEEYDIKGEKGGYFTLSDYTLDAGESTKWGFVANVNQNHAQVVELNHRISTSAAELVAQVNEDIARGTKTLIDLVASADGLQNTSDLLKDARHFSNVLFNIMRGGIFDDNYSIEKHDFSVYLNGASRKVVQSNQAFLESLPDVFDLKHLNDSLKSVSDSDLQRLAKEYLPLKFSRRHGDPSRPWNKFSINTNSEIDGSKILDYEGNWRDIFQNWEALVHSYPLFIEGMISKFLNATTADGYNPYRVTKGGFDWETIEPDNPWSYIGYWGDHQIIYLLKFLEFYQVHYPKAFEAMFSTENYAYAHVPYRIKSYEDIVKDPKDTIVFDHEADKHIREAMQISGADGALLSSKVSDIHRVNFMEKIMATVLAKMSNFVPEGGIWMNTQRPEWNDANNALVGNGVSMVTLYYLRRFLAFFNMVVADSKLSDVHVSVEMTQFFNDIKTALASHKGILNASISDADRKSVTDALGLAGSNYRNRIYEQGFSGNKSVITVDEIKEFIKVAVEFLEHSIRANKRSDNLYHAYNILSFTANGIKIDYLSEMLEGQVAAISSGYLSPKQTLDVLNGMRLSALYRPDQNSYILYPNKNLAGFLQRNNIPADAVAKSKLLQKLIADSNVTLIQKDINAGYHFNGNFKNAGDVKVALEKLKSTSYADLVQSDEKYVLEVFEQVFNHKAFTGRSGTFYSYEGLGSIYWHMVSKLHLAVMEVCKRAAESGTDAETLSGLYHHFEEIGKGIGVHKAPELYGAFPTDPYSHTPYHRGAQQPGMTGQVKEDILTRIYELGVAVVDGKITFNPILLKKSEFLNDAQVFDYYDVKNEQKQIEIPQNALSFTYCQVPVIYKIHEESKLVISMLDGTEKSVNSHQLDDESSQELFSRTGKIASITVYIHESQLLK